MSHSIKHVPSIDLNNGTRIPAVGLGVFQIADGGPVKSAVSYALSIGYRHIDTASVYRNERGVGEAIAESGIKRAELFVTSKVWNSDQGFDETLNAFDFTLDRLDLTYLDLYLIHWPKPALTAETWRAMQVLADVGKARAIGVSNFKIHHLEALLKDARIVPAVNQVEMHVLLQQPELRKYCEDKGIVLEAWAPLMQGRLGEVEALKPIAIKHRKTPAQIALRWLLDLQCVVLPKSVTPSRIAENIDVFDFALDASDHEALAALDRGQRIGPDPDLITF
jgi:diketogulonate reductase-like aldo/keto reductase